MFDTILAKQMKEKSVFDNAVERPIEGSKGRYGHMNERWKEKDTIKLN